MKKSYFMLSMLFACVTFIATAQTKTDTIKVSGNCGMCKSNIEKAATAAGAVAADWNKETKLLVVSYDAAKTSNKDIQKKIAASGYDTQDVKADDGAYENLAKCCQYDRTGANATQGGTSCCKDTEKCTKEGCCKADMSCCRQGDKADCCANGKCKSGK